jgi:hypothetical protein
MFKDYFLIGGPSGCMGAANWSGWLAKHEFLSFMQHVVKHTGCSKEHLGLIIVDKHISHISIAILHDCKQQTVILLSLPPHTSHRLQPLDLWVYCPFKSYTNAS